MSPPITDTSGRRMDASGLFKLRLAREEDGLIWSFRQQTYPGGGWIYLMFL